MCQHMKRSIGRTFTYIYTVLTLLGQTSYGDSYLLNLYERQRNFLELHDSRDILLQQLNTAAIATQITNGNNNNNNNNNSSNNNNNGNNFDTFQLQKEAVEQQPNNFTKVFVITNTSLKNYKELSQSNMDVITVIWYVATFLALAAFFLLMACSDHRCNDELRNGNNNTGSNAGDTNNAPLTPTPSYSEFAPPSYETVMNWEKTDKGNIFLVPCAIGNSTTTTTTLTTLTTENKPGDSNIEGIVDVECAPVTLPVPTTPVINFTMINELQKLGS